MAIKMMRKNNMKILNDSIWDLPSFSSLTYSWNLGSMLGLCLLTQIVSGLSLSMHYVAHPDMSFSMIVMMMQDVKMGWMIRLIHMNGASMFFMMIYLHMLRGLMFSSYQSKKTWMSGFLMLMTLMGTSFFGYVLPWGQMSYWGVSVITSLITVIPMAGESLLNWIWGDVKPSEPTLKRFYSLHFILPLMMTMMMMTHLFMLHKEGSSNNLGLNSDLEKMSFHPYYTSKDLMFMVVTLWMFLMICMEFPMILGDPVNNIKANPMKTPVHIQPEWYFLPSYAILRSMDSKVTGVMMLLMSVLCFLTMMMFKNNKKSKFSYTHKMKLWSFSMIFLFLMKLGSMPAEEPYTFSSKLASMIYFGSIYSLIM